MGEAWDKRRNHDLIAIAKAIDSCGEIGATRPAIVAMTGLGDKEVRAGVYALRKRGHIDSTGQSHHELAFYTLALPLRIIESELKGDCEGASMDATALAEATGCMPVPFGMHHGAQMRVEDPEAQVKQILSNGYTTANECAFVRGLGTWANPLQVRNMTRTELLRQYVVAAEKRKTWGNISKHVVIEAAREAMAELRGPA